MKTKREVLESIVKVGSCHGIRCNECPYDGIRCHEKLFKIGAMAILRQNRKKRKFDSSKILTCITADKAKVGMRGYFGDDLVGLKSSFERNFVQELLNIQDERFSHRFLNVISVYTLFYPIDEEVK